MANKKMGRPSAFTDEIKKEILNAIRLGNYREVSAEYAGVCISTFKGWLTLGRRQKTGPYAEFLAEVLHAEKKAEVLAVGAVRSAGNKDAKFFQWWLERKAPERWGRN